MNKTIKAGALLVAGIFALSGCGGGDAESASAPSPSATAAALTVGQEQYTAGELEEALAAVKAGQGLDGEVANDAALRPQLKQSADPDGVSITPEQCNGILGFANFFGDVDNANVAGLMISGTEKLTVISHADASVLEKHVEDTGSLLDECAEFELAGEEEGQMATGTTERREVSTDAPSTEAFIVTLAGGGQEFSGMKVAAASGTTSISVTVSDASDAAAAVTKAEETINAVFAELEAK